MARRLLPLLALAALLPQAALAYGSTMADTCRVNTWTCYCDEKYLPVDVNVSGVIDEVASECSSQCQSQGSVPSEYEVRCTTMSGFEGYRVTGGAIEYEATTTTSTEEPKNDPVVPVLNVDIPGLEFTDPTQDGGYTKVSFLAEYVDALYRILMVACAIVAVVMLMVGGLQYILSRGSAHGVKLAKERIKNAVVGMVLLMSAYSIAYLLDPSTTRFAALSIQSVPEEELPVESETDTASYGATSSVDPADVTTLSGEHLIVHTSNKRIAKDVLDALNAAATRFYTASASYGTKTSLNIRVTSASRSVSDQARLFYNNCIGNGHNGVCNPGTCNPARNSSIFSKSGSRWTLAGSLAGTSTSDSAAIIAAIVANGDPSVCQHTNYVAVDVWPEGQGYGYIFNVELMNVLTQAMTTGSDSFCRIANEPWHFELASKGSSSCSKVSDSGYKANGTSYSTAACRTWSGLSHCCKEAVDKSSPPATMCSTN
ncbi:hypothetical protein HYS28_02015 [Candidatus Uhrbacteria bacterium]|nr:hypothetical protein [Candidatus Uhrbacteria bacterium]